MLPLAYIVVKKFWPELANSGWDKKSEEQLQNVDSHESIAQSAKRFFAGTLFSRFMGMARDVTMAFCFGSSPEVAAFMVAYRLANLFRRLFGEGNLQGVFIPYFEKKNCESQQAAAQFYRDLFYSMAIALLGAAGLCALAFWGIGCWVGSDIPLMMSMMVPGVVFLCLYALDSCVLQCQKCYFLPAFAPVAFNAVWIVFAFLLHRYNPRAAMFGLSLGVVLSFAIQWQVAFQPVCKWIRSMIGWHAFRRPSLFSRDVRFLYKPLSMGIIGIGAAQINSAVDAIFARLADPSGPAYLWYAIRIQQLPLALFGIALSSALLPPLTRAMQAGAIDQYTGLLQKALRQSAVLMIPCSFGVLALAPSGLDLLYGRGEFNVRDVTETSFCLYAYASGLVPMVFVLLLANGFYAKKEYRYPMRCSLISVTCNIVLNALSVFILHWGVFGIALSTTLCAVLNAILLAAGLNKQIGPISLWLGNGRLLLCCLLAAMITFWIDQNIAHSREFIAQLTRFFVEGAVYITVLLSSAYLTNSKEIWLLLRKERTVSPSSGRPDH
jgi:putative peptidoglycan lipid II flippase